MLTQQGKNQDALRMEGASAKGWTGLAAMDWFIPRT